MADKKRALYLRKQIQLFIALLIFSTYLAYGAETNEAIVARPYALHAEPDFRSQVLQKLTPGTKLQLQGEEKQGYLKVRYKSIAGWIFRQDVVLMDDPLAAAWLFSAAGENSRQASRERRKGAVLLYEDIYKVFPDSPYAPEALYRQGEVAWSIEEEKHGQYYCPHTPYIHASSIRIFETLVKVFPNSTWADKAAFYLIKTKLAYEYEGFPEIPLQEIKLHEEFLSKYPNSDKKPEALLAIAQRHRSLNAIYSHEKLDVRDPERASLHQKKAKEIYERILRDYPGSLWAAKSEIYLDILKKGKPSLYVP